MVKAKARAATANLRIEVDRRWFWNFTGELVDLLRQVAADARRRGETVDANAIEARIDDAVEQLERVQKREATK